MTQVRDKAMTIVLLIIGVVAALLLVAAITHGARGDELTITPGKFYVTATISDGASSHVYTKLAYNPAGPFDTLDACNAWKPDATFAEAVPKLIEAAIGAFGPGTQVSFACETPPLPGEHV